MEWGGSWGHSARHGHRDPSIAALILDSPFASLEMVVRELIVAGRGCCDMFKWLHQENNLSYQGTYFIGSMIYHNLSTFMVCQGVSAI